MSWNASTSYGATGYILYYGTTSGVYTYTNNNGLATNLTLTNLQVGTTYYFVVTDFNASGYESSPSSQVSYTVSSLVSTNPVIT
ncbi:MAG TPA: fibronectin type III domain-containing protein, partial [Candidatus Acidoferrum sp.]|nr:fibronectin type III domain-containing protein [Candidatus Acidoferrum sp.]